MLNVSTSIQKKIEKNMSDKSYIALP